MTFEKYADQSASDGQYFIVALHGIFEFENFPKTDRALKTFLEKAQR